jgi:hypothetical protein
MIYGNRPPGWPIDGAPRTIPNIDGFTTEEIIAELNRRKALIACVSRQSMTYEESESLRMGPDAAGPTLLARANFNLAQAIAESTSVRTFRTDIQPLGDRSVTATAILLDARYHHQLIGTH